MNEEKAIVSNIAGTTRDLIEDELNIEGFKFRFIDTAGIRKTATSDTIENLELKNHMTKPTIKNYFVFDRHYQDIENQNKRTKKIKEIQSEKILVVNNKTDLNLCDLF